MGVDQLVTGGDVDDPVVDSLTTGKQVIGGLPMRLVETKTDADVEGSEITFDNLSDGTRYGIRLRVRSGSSGNLQWYVNGDDADGAYEYFIQDGTKITDEDTVSIVDGGTMVVEGWIFVQQHEELFGAPRIGINNALPAPIRIDALDQYCDIGGFVRSGVSLNSMTFRSSELGTTGTEIQLWEWL